MTTLPELLYEDLLPTRDYLQGAAHVLGSLQRAFLPKDPHDWQYGLEVTMRGLSTQPFSIGSKELRASLDLVKHKFRLEGSVWPLEEYASPELLNNVRVWLAGHGLDVRLPEPPFPKGVPVFDRVQADSYAAALWWLDEQFRHFKTRFSEGLASPILLYPHHFDLSLVWFPLGDDKQLALGFSTGDETIAEPYIYLTAYPDPVGFTDIKLSGGAYWQSKGFNGAILPYAALQASKDPEKLLRDFVLPTCAAGQKLLV